MSVPSATKDDLLKDYNILFARFYYIKDYINNKSVKLTQTINETNEKIIKDYSTITDLNEEEKKNFLKSNNDDTLTNLSIVNKFIKDYNTIFHNELPILKTKKESLIKIYELTNEDLIKLSIEYLNSELQKDEKNHTIDTTLVDMKLVDNLNSIIFNETSSATLGGAKKSKKVKSIKKKKGGKSKSKKSRKSKK